MALNVEDLEFTSEGLKVLIRRSKSDQEGQGQRIGMAFGMNEVTCPVRALQAWLAAAGITEGPVFRRGKLERLGDRAVALAVKRYARAAGLDAALATRSGPAW